MTNIIGFKQFIFIVLTVFMLAVGQVLFKLAAGKMDIPNDGLIAAVLFNPALIIALVVYGVATVCWMIVLSGVPLKLAYPFGALGFFLVPLMAHFFLGEPMRWPSFVGAAIIMTGVYVSLL